MSASITETVAGYDIQPGGTLRVSAIMRLFQRAAEKDLASFGMYHQTMLEHHLAFVISQIVIRLFHPIREHDIVTVRTYPRTSKGICFTREYTIDVNDTRCVEATSKWVLIDTDKRAAVRPSALDALGSITPDDSDPISVPSVRFGTDLSKLTKVDERLIYPSMLDANGHVNNTVYPDFVTDYGNEQTYANYNDRLFVLHFQHELTAGQRLTLYNGVSNGLSVTVGRVEEEDFTAFSAAVTL